MKHAISRLFVIILTLMLICITIFSVSAASDGRIEAHKAYYDYLKAEIDGLGGPVRDEDYYEMFTDKVKRPAIVEKLLAVYLVDVTNDNIEELVIKRYVTQESSAMIDSKRMEWVCIYSYIDGEIRRIGQNQRWCRPSGEAYTYYEPDGYIGDILSFYDYPNISDDCVTIFWGKDGEAFLCDGEVSTAIECCFSFYSFNGTHMERTGEFLINFIPDWSIGSISSSYGRHSYKIDGETVEYKEFKAKVEEYTAGGSYKLQNNDYHEVLNILSLTTQGKDVPYGDANPHCHIPSDEWTMGDGQHYHTCRSGCDVKLDLDSCSGGIATCLEKAKCKVCQQYYGELKEHAPSRVYSYADGQHFFKCCVSAKCTVVFDKEACADDNRDHRCDVCKKSGMGTHEAAAGTHVCDYCGKRDYDSECVDNIPDHKCDYCDEVLSECADSNRDHECDLCKAGMGTHQAPFGRHSCSYCNEPISECEDDNRDHRCDICREYFGVHEAVDSHICNYCGYPVVGSTCKDSDKDHACDICGEYKFGTHMATAGTHICNYCKAPVSECEDSNRDHKCDICQDNVGTHEAPAGKHVCDYCKKSISECGDSDKDHECDVCGKSVGVHKAAVGTHVCDYCNASVSDCKDDNHDHECDICHDSVSECKDSNQDQKCDICGKGSSDNGNEQRGCAGVIDGATLTGIALVFAGVIAITKRKKERNS